MTATDKSSAPDRLRNFNAHAIVDQSINYTIVGGRFTPAVGIDLDNQDVTLSVAGAKDFRVSLSPGSFKKTGLGGHVASGEISSIKTDILLQPVGHRDWAYSAGIDGFAPGPTPVTVCLQIGHQVGRATVKAYEFRTKPDGPTAGLGEDTTLLPKITRGQGSKTTRGYN